MPIADRIIKYSVSVLRSNLHDATRTIDLSLESGATASIRFVRTPPANFVRFSAGITTVFMTRDQFEDAYSVLRGESPVFLTALNLLGLQVGNLHTERDLGIGETPGEGDQDPQSLEALVRHARHLGTDRA